MNITFLIGNGFDRNLGLATTYSDFVKEYKKIEPATDTLRKFKKYIKENEEMWSAAEIAFGEFTSQFEKGEAEYFSRCQADFCEQLAIYLKQQEDRIDYEFSKGNIETALKNLNKIIDHFPTQENAVLNAIYQRRQDETRVFNFVCFNYTSTLERCLEIINSDLEILGTHTYKQHKINHSLGRLIHVHGTVDKDMIFGVNDETQISKNDIFNCTDGDLYKSLLIKQAANESYLENTDLNAAKLIENSSIIYIYGMSIGKTDKLWWERICKWLNTSSERHLIIHKYNAPSKGVIPLDYQIFERRCKREFTQYSTLDERSKANIEHRIHIATENIFDDIKNIAEETRQRVIYNTARKSLSSMGVN